MPDNIVKSLKNIEQKKKCYKFRILDMYKKLSSKKKQMFNISMQINNISRTSFYTYCHILFESKQDIPSGKLDVLALLLNSTAENLKNYTMKTSENNKCEISQVIKRHK